MPLTPLAVLNKVIENRVPTLRRTTAPFLQNLYENGRMKTKTNTTIDWDVEVGGGGVAIEPVTADGADTATDNTIPANIRIGRYRVKHQFSLSRVDIAEAATRAPEDLQDLFNAHVDRGLTYIIREINRLIFEGDGTAASGEVIGLNKVLDEAYAYGGIDPVGNPGWKTINLSNAGVARNLTKNLLLLFDERIKVEETSYNMIVCHPTMGTKYNQLFDTMGGGAVVVNDSSDGFKKVELGHGIRTFQGTPIIEDPMCPQGKMIFLNAADIDVFTFKLANNPTPMSQLEATPNAWGLNISVAELPSNNSAKRKFEIYTLPQLRVYNRKSVQSIADLS